VTPSRAAVTRRQLLSGGAAASLAAVLAGRPDGPRQLLTALARDVGGIPVLKESSKIFSFQVEREEDLVLLDITFHGFLLNSGGGQVTSLVPGGSDNIIVVQFPPQAIGEAAYEYKQEPEWYVDPPPVMSAVAGPSRLCFTLNTGQQVDFPTMTPADLLDWSSWTLLVPEVAQVDEAELERIDAGAAAQSPRSNTSPGSSNTNTRPATVRPATATPLKPSETVTAIEYPYALFLAPTVYTGGPFFGFTTTFSGRAEPLFGEYEPEGYYGAPQSSGISDCWTAALSVSYDERLEYYRELGDYGRLEFYEKLTDEEKVAFLREFGGGEFGGIPYTPPPQPHKPEVAAIWTRDYEYEPEGVTSDTYINYEPFEIQIRRPVRVTRGGRSRGAGQTRADRTLRARRVARSAGGAQPAASGAAPAQSTGTGTGGSGSVAKMKEARAQRKARAKLRRRVRRHLRRRGERRR
jgi:hypothetical protein